MGKDLAGNELGKGIRQKLSKQGKKYYQCRATVNHETICISGTNLKELKREFERRKKEASSKKTMITLDEWYEKWFETYKRRLLKESSILVMQRKYKNSFSVSIGYKPISSISSDDIQDCINQLADKSLKVSSIRDYVGHLRECLDKAVLLQYIPENPCLFVSLPKESKEEESRFLTEEEEKILLKKLEDHWYYECVGICLLTGLRVGEIGALKLSDVDFEKKLIHVRGSLMCQYDNGIKTIKITSPKTANSIRDIPFFGNAEELLRKQMEKVQERKKVLGSRWREGEMKDLVFVTNMGSPVTRYSLEKILNQAVKHINEENKDSDFFFEPIYPHALRHTFCSKLVRKGISIKMIQKIMGHQSAEITIKTYTHFSQEDFNKVKKAFHIETEYHT